MGINLSLKGLSGAGRQRLKPPATAKDKSTKGTLKSV
jgi:hypothetical protein